VYTYSGGELYDGAHAHTYTHTHTHTHTHTYTYTYTYTGELYDGDWVHGKKTGRGVFEFGSGDVYKGECLLMMMMNTMMTCVRV
jgi:hypothetical protein